MRGFFYFLCPVFFLAFFSSDVFALFDENSKPYVKTSPQTPQKWQPLADEKIIDFDVSPLSPEAAIIVKNKTGDERVVFWDFSESASTQTWQIPKGVELSLVVWHPLAQQVFFLAKRNHIDEILVSERTGLNLRTVLKSDLPLRRLIVGPRPFEVGYDAKKEKPIFEYRLFFGVKSSGDNFAIHSITESGARRYVVVGDPKQSIKIEDKEEQPNTIEAISALPIGFHPSGAAMVWQDAQGCFKKANYSYGNWDSSEPTKLMAKQSLCKGSVTYTPNGIGVIRWEPHVAGVKLLLLNQKETRHVAQEFKFISTPSSVADGRGIVGVTQEQNQVTLRYVPIEMPLSDVVNAWMFIESASDYEKLMSLGGFFRPTKHQQLYELYDTESYDLLAPRRPYLVTTDIFWELYASAFEGLFILSERQSAMPLFWSFIKQASAYLKKNYPEAQVSKMFLAVEELSKIKPSLKLSQEAQAISQAKGNTSFITDKEFDFGNLKPRSHYAKDKALALYFSASKYLMDMKYEPEDLKIMVQIPDEIHRAARLWIAAYEGFIAPPRGPLIWRIKGLESRPPLYVSVPKEEKQFFPLSFGLDNEVLFGTVDHILTKGMGVLDRNFPSGLDLSFVFGHLASLDFLKNQGQLSKYPCLASVLSDLQKRLTPFIRQSDEKQTLYQQWLRGLAVQWADDVVKTQTIINPQLWSVKRLQTGLASWTTLRHTTVLVNERTAAESGEGGYFEALSVEMPRGYVEPDVATFNAIAGLFDATIDWVNSHGQSWKGDIPEGDIENDASLRVKANAKLKEGVINRLKESRDHVLLFRDIAKKELLNTPLTDKEYESIFYVGRAAEHNFLVFKSLAKKDLALSTPEPMAKVVDVAGARETGLLLSGVGQPLEWDQIVPFFGRKEIVRGSVYAYHEIVSQQVLTDHEWRKKLPSVPRPAWLKSFLSTKSISADAKIPQ